MSVELKVPALGESITEAVVGKWHKQEGQSVSADEPVVALETDKVTIDVQAPSAGTLSKIAFAEGAKVKIGDVLGLIGEGAADRPSAPQTEPAAAAGAVERPSGIQPAPIAAVGPVPATPSAVERPSGIQPAPIAAVGPVPAPPSAVERPSGVLAAPAVERPSGIQSAPQLPPPLPRPPGPPLPAPRNGNGPAPTPVARAMAMDKGVDTAAISGSGIGGRVMKDDVVRATAPAAPSLPPAPVAKPTLPPAPSPLVPVTRAPGSREERVRLTPLRKRVAERLLQAQSTAAILTTFNEVDMSAVMALRKLHGERYEKKHGVKLGFMSFFVKSAIEALKAFPAVNAFLEGEEAVFHHYYDIGVAVSGSKGLVVPVLRDADQKSMAELEKEIADLGVRARADKLKLEELQGGTFTISNGGIFGSMLSTPILNPPQTGILGMHNIVERPVVRDGQIVIRPVMYLALSYDHRLIDGREAVQFLVRIKECIEAPERILLDV